MILLKKEKDNIEDFEEVTTQNDLFYIFKLDRYNFIYKNSIKLYIHNDGWCRVYDEDARLINSIFGYNLVSCGNKYTKDVHIQTGFPTNLSNKVIQTLEKKSINYVVVILSDYPYDTTLPKFLNHNRYSEEYSLIDNTDNIPSKVSSILDELDIPTITPYNHDEAVEKLTYLQNEKRKLESNSQEDKSRVYIEFGKAFERTVSIGDTIELSKVGSGKKEIFTIVPTTKEYIPAGIDGLDVWYKELSNTDHDLSKGEIESESGLAQMLIGKELNQIIINKDENGVDSEYRITNVIKRK